MSKHPQFITSSLLSPRRMLGFLSRMRLSSATGGTPKVEDFSAKRLCQRRAVQRSEPHSSSPRPYAQNCGLLGPAPLESSQLHLWKLPTLSPSTHSVLRQVFSLPCLPVTQEEERHLKEHSGAGWMAGWWSQVNAGWPVVAPHCRTPAPCRQGKSIIRECAWRPALPEFTALWGLSHQMPAFCLHTSEPRSLDWPGQGHRIRVKAQTGI